MGSDCCCLQQAAPVPVIQRGAVNDAHPTLESVAVLPAAVAPEVDGSTTYLGHLPGLQVPASPPLLALYCIWLK